MNTSPIKVIIADDGAFLETCIQYFEGSEIEVVTTATTIEGTLEKVERYKHEVAILILDIDFGNGRYSTEIIREIRQKSYPIKILIVSGLVHEIAFVLPFKGLVEGILHKNEDKALIKNAVRGIALGRTGFYSPECADILLNRDFRNYYNLTKEEIELLYLLTQGYTNTNRLAGYIVAKRLNVPSDSFLTLLKRTKYLMPEDIPDSKKHEKSVFDFLIRFVRTETSLYTTFSPILSAIRKPMVLSNGKMSYEMVSGEHLPTDEQLHIVLKREEGRIRRDLLPRIFMELDIESTIEALLWAQKWDLPKLYELSKSEI